MYCLYAHGNSKKEPGARVWKLFPYPVFRQNKESTVNYIVFDLEWNQAADLRTRRASSLLFEIIEIGAVKLNEKREHIEDRKSVV